MAYKADRKTFGQTFKTLPFTNEIRLGYKKTFTSRLVRAQMISQTSPIFEL